MFGYYIDLALRSLKRNRILTALMVLAIGLGIGASMTMLTVLHVMTADPIPDRSAQLFNPQIDPQSMEDYKEGEDPPDQLTWIDAMNLLHAQRGMRQVAMTGGQVTVRPEQGKTRAFFADARYTTADFFAMFDVPFASGNGWTAADDEKQARVAALSRKLADKLYGAGHAVGQSLQLGNLLLMKHYELPRLPLYYLPIGALVLWALGQLAVLGPALRAAAVPPVVATRSV